MGEGAGEGQERRLSSSGSDRATTLCLRCGLCCDGTLFTHVPVEPQEAEPLRASGVMLEEGEAGAASLRQPCSALKGTCCTVYADRPGTCRKYRCHLLIAVEEDEVSLKEALQVVDEARGRLAELDEHLPDVGEGEGSVTQRARRADRPEHGGPLRPELKRKLRELDAYLLRHFRGRFGHR